MLTGVFFLPAGLLAVLLPKDSSDHAVQWQSTWPSPSAAAASLIGFQYFASFFIVWANRGLKGYDGWVKGLTALLALVTVGFLLTLPAALRGLLGRMPVGMEPVRLTNHPDRDSDPSWSPDGKQIAFASTRDGDWSVYVMNADGSGVRRFADAGSRDREPAWSPHGQWIAFVSNKGIYLVRPDGSGLRSLEGLGKGLGPVRSVTAVSWSPDERHLTYDVLGGYESGNVFTGPIDGSAKPKRLTSGWTPAWSPQGDRIAFSTQGPKSFSDRRIEGIYSVGIDGKTRVCLWEHPFRYRGAELVRYPSWSPDGKRIAFHRHERLYTVNADGADADWLLNGQRPAWSPDGSRIAFCDGQRDGNWELYVIAAP